MGALFYSSRDIFLSLEVDVIAGFVWGMFQSVPFLSGRNFVFQGEENVYKALSCFA